MAPDAARLRRRQDPEAGVEVPGELLEQIADLMLALGTGLGMLKLADPESISPELLGAAYAVLLRTLETSEEARSLLLVAGQVRLSTSSSTRLRSSPPV